MHGERVPDYCVQIYHAFSRIRVSGCNKLPVLVSNCRVSNLTNLVKKVLDNATCLIRIGQNCAALRRNRKLAMGQLF